MMGLVTFNMIVENVDCLDVVSNPGGAAVRFSRLFLLGGARMDDFDSKDEAWMSETLFCGTPEDAKGFLDEHPNCFALSIRDKGLPSAPSVSSAARPNLLECESDQGLSTTFYALERYFFSIESWASRMKDSLLEGGGYQSLINCSEAVLKNFIMVSNSEFRLLAYSQSTPIDDPTTKLIIEQGIHSEETIELFKKYQIMKDWKAQKRITFKPASEMTVNPVMDYVFKIEGNYFIHVLMHCNLRPATPGLADAFQLLIDHMRFYVQRTMSEQVLLYQEPSRLFNDLIAHRTYGDDALDIRLRGTGVPKTAAFTLYVFDLISENSDDLLLLFYVHQLKDAFPWCFVGLHDLHVIALDPIGKLEESISTLQSFVNLHPCTIGMSSPFRHLNEFHLAYQQALSAVELARSPHRSLASAYLEDRSDMLHSFDRCFAAYVADIASSNSELVMHNARDGIVARIVASDMQRGTQNARMLFFYLACERKASVVCKKLFLHRNTLLYNMNKLQREFDFDLDDFHTRQRIMLEYLFTAAP